MLVEQYDDVLKEIDPSFDLDGSMKSSLMMLQTVKMKRLTHLSTAIEPALKWMHEMGYEVLTSKKGVFVDNHERHNVVE